MVYKVIVTMICYIMEKYAFLFYLCLTKYRLSKGCKIAMNKIYDNITEFCIVDIFMNFVSCHGSSTYKQANNIFTCRSSLVSYYLSKGFMVI